MQLNKSIYHIVERIKVLKGFKSDQDVSDLIGMSRAALSNHKTRETIPYEQLATFCRKEEISLDWLLFGREIDKESDKSLENTHILIPKYNIEAAAGKGKIYFKEEIIDNLAFSKKWIEKAGLDKENLSIITVEGDSMEPTLKEGDVVLIDHRYNTLKDDSVYVILMDGKLRVKRLQTGPHKVIIVSDNPKYTLLYIDIKFIDDLIKIVGKVAWIGKML